MALGTLATGGAHAAFPFDPVQVDLYLSGASAVQNNFKAQLSALLNAGYKTACDNSTANCSEYFAVTGTLKSAAPVPAVLFGKTARIIYRTRGGSVLGVDPVARAEKVQWMDMASGTCSTTAPAGESVVADYYCSPLGTDGANDGRVPDLGVSDVEPRMFQSPLNVEWDPTAMADKPQLSPADLNALSPKPAYQQAFGVPVTNVISTSMFLNKPMVTSMLGKFGQMHDWANVPGAPVAAINPGQATKPVVVCRRVQGSGTQATANYFVSNFGCAGSAYDIPGRMATDSAFYNAQGSGLTKYDPIFIDPSLGYTVVENPGSGDVRSCLTAAQIGTNWTFKADTNLWHQVTFSGVGKNTAGTTIYTNADTAVLAPYGAVGVLSYDSAGLESGWHYHDLNGFLTANAAAIDASARPATSTAKYALAAMMEGSWDYYGEVSMQYRNGSNGKPALGGDLKTLADALITIVGDPAKVTPNKGIAALAPYVPTGNVTTNKVSKVTKSANTCNTSTLFYPPAIWAP